MQQRTVFTDDGFRNCSWGHTVISTTELSVFNAMPPEGQKITGNQYWFSAMSFVYRNFSGFSEFFFNDVYRTWWNPQILCSFTLRDVILKLLNCLPMQSFTEWWTPLHLYLRNTQLSSQFFWNMLLASNSKSAYISQKTITFLSFNIWYVVFVLFSMTHRI